MLTGAERRVLRESILAAFDYSSLKQALSEASNSRDLGDLVNPEASYDDRVAQLITRSIKEGWTQELLQTLLDARRGKKEFVDAVEPIAERARSPLRKIVGGTRRRVLSTLAASVVLTAVAVYWFASPGQRDLFVSKFLRFSCEKPDAVFGKQPPTWKPLEATNFDLVLSVRAFKQPHNNCELSQTLDTQAINSKFGSDVLISEADLGGIRWYRIEAEGQPPTYVRKSDIPVWTEAPEVEIVPPIQAYTKPIRTAAVQTLQPQEFRRLARHRPLRKASIGGENWYRLVGSRETSEFFFPESENRHRIVEWQRIAGCAVTKQLNQGFVYTWRSLLGSDAIDQLPPNTRLGPIVQEPKNATHSRLRFGRDFSDFKYIERSEVEILDTAKCQA